MDGKTHTITWLSLLFIILTFLFFLASVFVLEFAVTVDKDGDILIPWYYWFFFAGAGVFLIVFVILQAISVPYSDKQAKMISDVNKRYKKDEDIYSLVR